MKDYKTMTVTELDRLYWETYGAFINNKSSKTYNDYCEVCGAIVKELESRGLTTPSQVADKIKEERMSQRYPG